MWRKTTNLGLASLVFILFLTVGSGRAVAQTNVTIGNPQVQKVVINNMTFYTISASGDITIDATAKGVGGASFYVTTANNQTLPGFVNVNPALAIGKKSNWTGSSDTLPAGTYQVTISVKWTDKTGAQKITSNTLTGIKCGGCCQLDEEPLPRNDVPEGAAPTASGLGKPPLGNGTNGTLWMDRRNTCMVP
jgi:hypothetical protein